MRNRLKKGGALAGVVFGVVALTLVLIGYVRGAGTDDWQPVKGEVINCSLESVLKIPFVSSTGQHGGGRGLFERSVRILYKYTVAGAEHVSDAYEIGFLGFTTNMRGSQTYLRDVLNICGKYAPGAEVDVYIDPSYASSALLKKGYQGYLPTYLIFIFAVIGVSVYGGFKE